VPAGKYVAVLGEDGSLCVLDTAFERKLVEFDTKASSPPSQLAWCGEDSVAVAWEDRGVLLVGPFGDSLKLELDEPVCVVQEVDGLRLITNGKHELLQRVPGPLLSTRAIGSTSPGALLLDACSMFLDEDAKCDEAMRGLMRDGSLPDGVGELLGAALAEWDPAHQ
jgi:vacuolar protein sorting-associated protein 16